MSNAAKRHMNRVAQLPCCLCGARPVQVHHLREGEAAGAGQRANDWLTIPLCEEHHRTGGTGVHGDRSMLRLVGKTEHDLLGETLERIYGGLR